MVNIFQRPIIGHPEKVVAYTKAAIAQHNNLGQLSDLLTICPDLWIEGIVKVTNSMEVGEMIKMHALVSIPSSSRWH